MIPNIKILRKSGWIINPNDEIVNKVLNGLIESEGHCPTNVHNRIGHNQCPCSAYIQCDVCYCGLYVKDNNITNDNK